MAALSETNLKDFDKESQHGKSVRPNRRASIISYRSSISGSLPLHHGMGGRRLSRAFTTGIGGYPGAKSSLSMGTVSPSKNQRVRYENTYQMQPDPEAKFKAGKCQEILRQILAANLDGETYEARTVGTLTKTISDQIKLRVKDLKIPRYKIISQVFIGSKGGQSMQMSSRSVWNPDTDNFASQSYESESLFAVVTVHCTYFE